MPQAIENGLAYLAQQQNSDGGFGKAWGTDEPSSNANSTGRVIYGLSALQIDIVGDERFNQNGRNMLAYLLSLQNEDGGFAWQSGDSDGAATIDAVQALSAYVRMVEGQEGLYDLTNVGISAEALQMQIEHAQSLVTKDYTVSSYALLQKALEEARSCTEPARYAEVFHKLQAAEENLRKPAVVANGQVDLSSAGEKKVGISLADKQSVTIEQGTGQAEAYLEISAAAALPEIAANSTLNGQKVALVIPAETTANAEVILLPKAQDTQDKALLQKLRDTVQANVTVSQHIQVGGSAAVVFNGFVTLTFAGAGQDRPAYLDHGGQLHLIGTDQEQPEYYEVVGQDLVVHTTHFSQFVVYRSTSSSGGGGNPVVSITVDASRAAAGFGQLSGTVAYYDGLDAVSALKNFLGESEVVVQGSYVVAVKGLSQQDDGPESGWMYSINGRFPEVGAQKLSAGDTLYWGYTLNMGEDLKGNAARPVSGTVAVLITDKERAAVTASVQKALTAVQRSVLTKESVSVWEAFALAAGGQAVPSGTYEALVQEVQAVQGNFRKVTDLQRMILAVTALGYDATQTGDYDLVAAVYRHENLTKQGNNGVIYALLALDSGNYQTPADALWTREKLVAYLLAQQNDDGGFALVKASPSDVDLSAMAVQALAPYQAQAKVREATERALGYLSQAQQADGGFANGGVSNGESAAQVLLALTALGIDPLTDGRFIKDKTTLWDQVLSYQLADGTFCHTRGGASDELATEQGLLALTAMARFLQEGTGIFTGFAIQSTAVGFKDSAQISPWAAQVVQAAVEKGWLAGYADGTFRPQEPISRAEFTALLLRAMEWPEDSLAQAPFTDTADKWYKNAAAAAYERGLVKGSGNAFAGEAHLTREELAAMLCRVQGLAESDTPAALADWAAISPWAVGAVQTAYAQGLLVGDGAYFYPQGAVTREMAACAVFRAVQ